MKLFPCYLLAIACTGFIASTPALSAEGGPGPAHGPHDSREPGMPPHGGPGMLHGVHLSEAQEQKAFAISHAAEPLMFEQSAALRKAHEQLRELGAAPRFDEARAAAAASAAGNASAAMALSRARVASQLVALLTPEQRAQLDQRRPAPPR